MGQGDWGFEVGEEMAGRRKGINALVGCRFVG